MARNASGTYTLPSGNPVVSGTLIDATWANNTLSDLGNEMTDSLSRSGEGAMLAPLRITDGVQATPSLAFSNEPSSGLYRAGSNEWWAVAAGVQNLRFTNTGLTTRAAAGAVGTPSIAAFNDTDTGIYFPGANELAIATGGAARMTFDSAGGVAVPGTFTLSGGTANGVAYLNGSKVLTSGSGMVFDGTRFFVGTTTTSTSSTQSGEIYSTGAVGFMLTNTTAANFPISIKNEGSSGTRNLIRFYEGPAGGTVRASVSLDGSNYLTFDTNNFIINTGNLGIGTASPASGFKLDVVGGDFRVSDVASDDGVEIGWSAGGNSGFVQSYDRNASAFRNLVLNNAATIDSSGSLGLGVTPSAWNANNKSIIQLQNTANLFTRSTGLFATSNFVYNSADTGVFQANGYGIMYQQNQTAGTHVWLNTANNTSGAGATASLISAMTLDANGVLLRGNTTARSTNALGAGQMQVEAASFSVFQMFANANSVDGSYMGLWKSRGGAVGGTTIVQNGDLLGGIYFGGYDGTTAQPAALIAAFVDGTPGASDMPGRITFSTSADGSANPTERGRFTSGGFFKASNDGSYNNSGGLQHEFRNSNATNTIITATHSSVSDPYGLYIGFTAAAPDNNSNYFLRCEDNAATRCIIYSDGDLANHDGVYGTISDERLKQDIVDAGSQWDDLKSIRFRKYRMKTDVEANPDAPAMFGVVAQELAQVCPGLVDEHPNMKTVEVTDEEGNVTQTQEPDGTTTMTVKSSILLMKAAKALQEAMARIEQLEAKVAALEAA